MATTNITDAEAVIDKLFTGYKQDFANSPQYKLVIFHDKDKDSYVVFLHGQDEHGFHHDFLINLLITENGEIVILKNNSDYPVANDLVELKFDRNKIILAYQSNKSFFT